MIEHWSTDRFASRTTVHGLPSDEVRSALHKHVRQGRLEPSVRAAVELARTDADHEDMMWQRLRVIAAEDVGLAEPFAIAIIAALHDSAGLFGSGSYERATFAAQAAAYLATAFKDPTASEILQVALHDDLSPEIPDEAICVHTKRGQLLGRTVRDWWFTGSQVHPERPGRSTAWREQLDAIRMAEPDRPPLPDPADGRSRDSE